MASHAMLLRNWMYLQVCSRTPGIAAAGPLQHCNLCEEDVNVINTVSVNEPDPTIGGQLPNPNECNSTLTSETRGDADP